MPRRKILTRFMILMLSASAFPAFANALINISDEAFPTPVKSFDSDAFTLDGPYVFYKKDKIVVKTIKLINTAYQIFEEEYDINQPGPILNCQMDSKSGPSFDIHIRKDFENPPTVYDQPSKLLAISDIEGNFHALLASLKGNQVVDDKLQWIFGTGHLVVLGDVFDRGVNVTACLWLIYELERQAALAGGQVHFIIGNHEEMNMRGDLRYVRNKYKIVAKKLEIPYKALYSENTVLGKWMRSKNIIEKIGETLFTHGGLSPKVSSNNIRLEELNSIARANYGRDRWKLQEKGGYTQLVFENEGPMWYRGYFSDELDQQTIDNICNKYGVARIVVGHTIVNEISTLFNGRVYAIDVKHITMMERKDATALLFTDNEIFKVNTDGGRQVVNPLITANTLVVFQAIKNNEVKTVQKFLERGGSIDKYYTNENITMLHYAIKHDKLDVVKLLIENEANPDRFYGDKTALMFAIKEGKNEIARYLISSGVDLNTQNFRKKTAIYYAAKYGDPAIARQLVENGAVIHLQDYKGRTPIDYAVENSNTAVVHYFKSLQ